MKINQTNTTFCARNPIIRKADDIARKVNNTFPRISPSIVEDYSQINKFSMYIFRLKLRMNQVRNLKSHYFDHGTRYIEKALAFFEPIERYKMGNCAESAQMGALAAKINGIENAKIKHLRSIYGDNLDHMICYVENGKNPYVIDPWLGFADYVPNAMQKYAGEYRKHFEMGNLKPNELVFSTPFFDDYCKFLENEAPKNDLEKLKILFSKLLLK